MTLASGRKNSNRNRNQNQKKLGGRKRKGDGLPEMELKLKELLGRWLKITARQEVPPCRPRDGYCRSCGPPVQSDLACSLSKIPRRPIIRPSSNLFLLCFHIITCTRRRTYRITGTWEQALNGDACAALTMSPPCSSVPESSTESSGTAVITLCWRLLLPCTAKGCFFDANRPTIIASYNFDLLTGSECPARV